MEVMCRVTFWPTLYIIVDPTSSGVSRHSWACTGLVYVVPQWSLGVRSFGVDSIATNLCCDLVYRRALCLGQSSSCFTRQASSTLSKSITKWMDGCKPPAAKRSCGAALVSVCINCRFRQSSLQAARGVATGVYPHSKKLLYPQNKFLATPLKFCPSGVGRAWPRSLDWPRPVNVDTCYHYQGCLQGVLL